MNSKLDEGFSLIEVLISTAMFFVFIVTLLFALSSIAQRGVTIQKNIKKSVENVNEITKEYYIKKTGL